MERYRLERDADGGTYVETSLTGRSLLSHPMYNKGTAFTAAERQRFALEGLLPPLPSSEAIQLERAFENIVRKEDPLEQYIGLAAMQDRNEILFYKVVLAHIEVLAPIIYTPTVGKACQRYSHIFRRGRGIWLTPDHAGRMAEILGNAIYDDVRLIVATDNERILGLGDQGAGGMGIPIGKLVLYTVGAGIHPTQVLPVSLDVGTDNQDLLDDPLYLGWRSPRLRGEKYDALVEEFVTAVKERFPNALLQWEDFKKNTAFKLLDRYRERLLSFNDDIQGTAAVATAGVVAATRISGIPIADQRIVILGAGAAGIGIGRQLRDTLSRAGVGGDDLTSRIAVLDSRGMLIDDRDFRDDYKKEFAWPSELAKAKGIGELDLHSVVAALKPTVLIGTSGQPNTFTEEMVRTMAAHCERPAIFPFSNPTEKCEAHPKDLITWTEGKALVASGSPFSPVTWDNRDIRIGQGNNVYIFPGVGLGALVAKARRVSDAMFTVAATRLANCVEQHDLDEGALYPPLNELRDISRAIAIDVAMQAIEDGTAEAATRDEITARVDAAMWNPAYPEMRRS